MLHIFICPKCFNYRIVSRKPDAICFHCGATLHKSDIDYVEYIDMNEQERKKYKDKFINRMKMFKEKVEDMITEQEVK
ncbi:MAG: DNA-directed RNA polymerase subunit M [Anaerolineaceae bacterium]|nr:MAG: DNA-directed RNA polymerase subunit M [Anaerolineaceae bacterium]